MFTIFEHLNHPLKNIILAQGVDENLYRSAINIRHEITEYFQNGNNIPSIDGFKYHLNRFEQAGIVKSVVVANKKGRFPSKCYALADKEYKDAAGIVNKWCAQNNTDIADIIGVHAVKSHIARTNLENRLVIIHTLYHKGEHTTADLIGTKRIEERTIHQNLVALQKAGITKKPATSNRYSITGSLIDFYLATLPSAVEKAFHICKKSTEFVVEDTLPSKYGLSERDVAVQNMRRMDQAGVIKSSGQRNRTYCPVVAPGEFAQNEGKYLKNLIDHFHPTAKVQGAFLTSWLDDKISPDLLKDCSASEIKAIIGHHHDGITYLMHKMIKKGYGQKIAQSNMRGCRLHPLTKKGKSFMKNCFYPVYHVLNANDADINQVNDCRMYIYRSKLSNNQKKTIQSHIIKHLS